MIYSLTPFFNELDVLEIRLAELDPVVDRFIIAEAPVTQSGLTKPLHLAEHWERFARWHDKITYLTVDDMPAGGEVRRDPPVAGEACDSDHWLREKHQRRALMRGLKGIGLDEDDTLLLSDLDEIPFPQLVTDAARACREQPDTIFVPRLAMHVYRLRWRWREATIPVLRFFSPEVLWRHDGDLEAVRLVRDYALIGGIRDTDALGWHLAYMSDIPAKLAAKAHRELDTPTALANVPLAIAEGLDIFGRDRPTYSCPDHLMPPYVMANLDRFEHVL